MSIYYSRIRCNGKLYSLITDMKLQQYCFCRYYAWTCSIGGFIENVQRNLFPMVALSIVLYWSRLCDKVEEFGYNGRYSFKLSNLMINKFIPIKDSTLLKLSQLQVLPSLLEQFCLDRLSFFSWGELMLNS